MRGSRLWLPALALLLFSLPVYSQVYRGPALPEGWYPIHERNLERLDEIFSQQQTAIVTQQRQLDEAARQLSAALMRLDEAGTQSTLFETQLGEALRQSELSARALNQSKTVLQKLEESSSALEAAITRLTRQRTLALTGSGVLLAVTVWLALR